MLEADYTALTYIKMDEIKGQIQEKKIESKDDWTRAIFTINDKKYSTFDDKIIKEFNKGDFVKMTGEKKGIYWNMKTMEKDKAPQYPIDVPIQKIGNNEYHLSIEECRARALECAIKSSENKLPVAELLNLAVVYEEYIKNGNSNK